MKPEIPSVDHGLTQLVKNLIDMVAYARRQGEDAAIAAAVEIARDGDLFDAEFRAAILRRLGRASDA